MIALALAATAAAFNLSCTGTETLTIGTAAPYDHKESPFAVSYRIDLRENRWCLDGCVATHDIVKVEARQITLEEGPFPLGERSTIINRETGRAVTVTKLPQGSVIDMTVCEKQPFGGFPARRF